jgi:hypothetical protein
MRDATATRRGLMSTLAQTFAGAKTFLDLIKLALMPTIEIPDGGTELEGSILYDSTTKRIKLHTGTAWFPVVIATTGDGGTSLEEHIASTEAHPSSSISWDGGGTAWRDETPWNPSNVTDGVISIVDSLSGPYGAAKVGTAGGGGLWGENVQEQLDELNIIKVNEDSLAAETGASMVGAAPHVLFSNTNLQTQITELVTKKAALTGDTFTGITHFNAGAGSLTLGAGTSTDHVYLPFYARSATPNVRSGYIGYGGAASTSFVIVNEITNGNLDLNPGTGGKVNVNAPLVSNNNPASNAVTVANSLSAPRIIKCWGYITTGATPVVNDGDNIASLSYIGTTTVRVTFATPMANANYTITRHTSDQTGKAIVLARTVNYFDLGDWRDSSSSYMNLTTGGITFDFTIHGRQ